MGIARALGAALFIVCAVIIVLYAIYLTTSLWDFIDEYVPSWLRGARNWPLWIGVPVIIGVWAVCGIGAWLGWIMATTKEPAPIPEVTEEKKEEEEKVEVRKEKPARGRKRK